METDVNKIWDLNRFFFWFSITILSYTLFTCVGASSTTTDDVTKKVMHRIFNKASVTLKFDENSSRIGYSFNTI